MSYCRFSSDDFKSDFYVYADVSGGWTIHMAGARYVGNIPSAPLPRDTGDRAALARWMQARRDQRLALDRTPLEAIGLPHDGETFRLATAGECADKCAELAAMGYHLPAGVIEALREDDTEDA